MRVLKPVLAMLVALLVLDAIWIGAFMQGLYEREIGSMLRAEPNWVAALIFYLAYPLGAYKLVVAPALTTQSIRTALLNGAVLGAIAYGTFAVTNLSVIQGWGVTLTLVDTVWGAFVTAVVCGLGYLTARD